ncbi:protein amalgam-like isoform X2 [Hyalella azteca]|uniref:Protein amalgam-like isoform X2 n=1 Tax=Hyalella azteca TaxID=294128 RepID=A0A8B7N7Q4_HYAAZ|nr:protein amalgam-like isoform X2 [Hyalella azteca]
MITASLLVLLVAAVTSLPTSPDQRGDAVVEDLPQFTIKSQRLQVAEGKDVRIPCSVDRKYDKPMIIKKEKNDYNDDKLMFVGGVKLVDDRYKMEDGEMVISGVRRADAGAYLCYYQDKEDLKLRHFVEVQYPPTVHSITPLVQRVSKGSSVTLECTAEGNPMPKIRWSREGGVMPSGEESEEGLSMTLEGVDRHVEGRYSCTADNGVGEPVSVMMEVAVEYPPEIFTEKEIVRTGENDRVELVCIVHARPSAEVVWTKDGAKVPHENRAEEHLGGHRHLLTLDPVTKEDFGLYQCRAKNPLGESTKDIAVTDEPNTPNFTSNPNSAYENSYTITWDTESYYPITQYRIMYRKSQDMMAAEWTDLTQAPESVETRGIRHSLQHTITDLQPATDYEAAVQVKNKYQWGSMAKFNFSTRKEVMSLQTKASSACGVATSLAMLLATLALHCSV